jgi:hypothetical protein
MDVECRPGLLGVDRGPAKQSLRVSSLVKEDRQVTISVDEINPESGNSKRQSSTRSLVDKRNVDNPGNEISCKVSDRRHGADPPKNESGRGGRDSISGSRANFAARWRCVSAGKVSCILSMKMVDREDGRPLRCI